MAVLLHHPLVQPPAEVLHQALLYWDGTASVVPRAPEVYEAAVSAELRDLGDRSLYTPLRFDRDSMDRLDAPDRGRTFQGRLASQVLRDEQIDQSVEDYRKAAKSSRMAWVERSVRVAVGAAAAAGEAVRPGLGWALGSVGGIALNVATREIRPLARAREDHDFSHLHRVRETPT